MYAVSMKDQRLIAVSSANGHRPAMLFRSPHPLCALGDLRLHGAMVPVTYIAVHRHEESPLAGTHRRE